MRRLTLLSSGARPPLAGRSGRVAAPSSSSGTLLWRLQRRLALAPPVLPALLASLQHRNIDTGEMFGYSTVKVGPLLVSSNSHVSTSTSSVGMAAAW